MLLMTCSRKKILLIFLSVCLYSLFFTTYAFANEAIINTYEDKNILYISSYNLTYSVVPLQIDGAISVFKEYNINFDLEFMDTKRFNSPENSEYFYSYLKYKIEKLPPYETIIVADDNALDFAIEYQDELFKEIPIVFLGINDLEKAKKAAKKPYITGIVEDLSIYDTLKIAQKINPKATKIIAISDNTTTGKIITGEKNIHTQNYLDNNGNIINSFYGASTLFNNLDFQDINVSNYTFKEFEKMLSLFDKNTIVVYISMVKDKNNEVISNSDAVKMIAENINVPVYILSDLGIGSGIFGGKVISNFQQGKIAAEIVVDIIEGKPIANTPLNNDELNPYIFDYDLIKKYDIDENIFPDNTMFVNRELYFFQLHKEVFVSAIIFILVLFSIIIILLFNINKRKTVAKELRINNKELEKAYEEIAISEEKLFNQFIELEENKHQLQESEERYKLIFDLSYDGFCEINVNERSVYMWSDWYKEFVDEDKSNLGMTWFEKISEEDRKELKKLIFKVQMGEIKSFSYDYKVLDLNNNIHWISEYSIGLYDEDGKVKRIAATHKDITEKKLQEKKIEHLAYFDALTGIFNKAAIDKKIKTVLEKKEVKGSLFFMDLDNFKYINDTYSHSLGDEVLKVFAYRLSQLSLTGVTYGRFGGDEFMILAENYIDLSETIRLANKILSIFDEVFLIQGNQLDLTTSIGIATYPDDGDNIEDLYKKADLALISAKENGKNNYVFYKGNMSDALSEIMDIKNGIKRALIVDEFELFFQPIIDLNNSSVSGFEALIRWESKEAGFILPNKFISIAEKTGLIVPLGEWIFRSACKFAKSINNDRDSKCTISINVSPIQLYQNNFIDTVREIIEEIAVNPELIHVEITETALMEKFEECIEKINELMEIGMSVSLDDFGTGYSSLSYLKQLPINILKIDKSFIDNLLPNSLSYNLTEDIIMIAHKLGLLVIAEGVESIEQYRKLKQYNCDFIQGYLISRPLPAEHVENFLENEINFKDVLI